MKAKLKQVWLILSSILYVTFVFVASCVIGLVLGLGYFIDRIENRFD